MGLFFSTTIAKIDTKKRVSIPAHFRQAVANDLFKGVVLYKSYTHPALEGVSMMMMKMMVTRMDKAFDLFSEPHDQMAVTILGEANEMGFDQNGRITLTEDLMAHANLTGQAALIGLGKKFQIWEPSALEEYKKEARQNLKDKHITLPKAQQND